MAALMAECLESQGVIWASPHSSKPYYITKFSWNVKKYVNSQRQTHIFFFKYEAFSWLEQFAKLKRIKKIITSIVYLE